MEREVKTRCGWNGQDAIAVGQVRCMGLGPRGLWLKWREFCYVGLGVAVTESPVLGWLGQICICFSNIIKICT